MKKGLYFKHLYFYLKKIASKKLFKKIKKIRKLKNLDEKISVLEFALKFCLESYISDFEKKLISLEKENKDSFSLFILVRILKSKINYFLVSFEKQDFNKIVYLINRIKKEVDDV